MKAGVSHEQATIESFQRDPKFAAESLRFAVEDGDQENLLTTLRYIVAAFGGMKAVAKAAGINEKSAYRALSGTGNPTLHTLSAVTKAVGLNLSITGVPRSVGGEFAKAHVRKATDYTIAAPQRPARRTA